MTTGRKTLRYLARCVPVACPATVMTPTEFEQLWAWKMGIALDTAREALASDEVPIGAAVFRGDTLLASAHDAKESLKDPTAHAEILALREAGKVLGDWRLEGCDLVVTLEPCPMCAGAIIQARIARVVFGARNPRWGAAVSRMQLFESPQFNHHVEVTEGILAEECAELPRRYFHRKRGAPDEEG